MAKMGEMIDSQPKDHGADSGVGVRAAPLWDHAAVRAQFPLADPSYDEASGNGTLPLWAYLDNAATSWKPRAVTEVVRAYDQDYPANVHRGVHALSERATDAYENARATVARFLNAPAPECIVFTRGTTESINLVAQSWAGSQLRPGDRVLLSVMEHHSNLVPWQMAARAGGWSLDFVDITPDGRLDLASFAELCVPGVRLVAITGTSNVLGTVTPLEAILNQAHAVGAKVLVDAAQTVAHRRLDVSALGIDFLAFSGHKIYGPTGIGVLYAKAELLDAMPPWMGGGSMITRVDLHDSAWQVPPARFEAGTPPIAQAIGLAAALDWLTALDADARSAWESHLLKSAHEILGSLPGVHIHGPGPNHTESIVCFTVDGIHPHDLATIADHHRVAIRAGHHCAMPLHKRLGLTATARAGLALYNTVDELTRLADAVAAGQTRFARRKGS